MFQISKSQRRLNINRQVIDPERGCYRWCPIFLIFNNYNCCPSSLFMYFESDIQFRALSWFVIANDRYGVLFDRFLGFYSVGFCLLLLTNIVDIINKHIMMKLAELTNFWKLLVLHTWLKAPFWGVILWVVKITLRPLR